MADTVRTKSSLLSIYADNSAGDIDEQDGRDLIVSVLGCYAMLYVTGNSTAQTGLSTTPATLDWGNGGGNGPEDNSDADYTNDQIEIGGQGDGDYLLAFQGSFSGTASKQFTFRILNNSSPITGAVCTRLLNAGGDAGSCSIVALAALSDGDIITMDVAGDGAGQSITLAEAQLVVKRLG